MSNKMFFAPPPFQGFTRPYGLFRLDEMRYNYMVKVHSSRWRLWTRLGVKHV